MPEVRVGFWYRLVVALVRPWLVLLTKRDWRGAEHLAHPGGLVVTVNHTTYLDPFVFGHFLYDNGRPPRYLGKEAVFKIPVIGAIIRRCGQIPVSRESRDAAQAFHAAVEAVRAGECVAIYPEATLTRDPQLWPMRGKTGAARVALMTGCPVVPVAQWGAQEILPPYGSRPHLLPRHTVHLQAGPPVDLDDLRGQPLTPAVLGEATDRIMAAITGLLAGLRGEPGPARPLDPRSQGLPVTGNPHRRQRRPAATPAPEQQES